MISPKGFRRAPKGDLARAGWDADRWVVAGTAVSDEITEEHLARLHDLRGIEIDWPDTPVPWEVIGQLAAAGVPLHSLAVPNWLADPTLRHLLTDRRWLTPEIDSAGASVADLRREEHSVRLRRYGLRRPDRQPTPAGDGATELVSVVLAGRRPHLAASALGQIARQRAVDLEVIYAAHGFPADVVRQAARGFPFPLEVVEVPASTVFGDVLNEAVRRAQGHCLLKWDDDDWYGPEHVRDLLLARSYSAADVLGTVAEFFYLEPLDITIRRTDYPSEVAAPHVAGGTILLERDLLREVGGFAPVPRGVDERLLTTVVAAGGTVYRTHGLGYVLRRSTEDRHTWRQPLAHFLRVAANQWRGFCPSSMLEA